MGWGKKHTVVTSEAEAASTVSTGMTKDAHMNWLSAIDAHVSRYHMSSATKKKWKNHSLSHLLDSPMFRVTEPLKCE